MPNRPAQARHCGPNCSAVHSPPKSTRAAGAGRLRSSQAAGVAASPRGRLAKMPTRISRQPSSVLTIVPSVPNSMSPAAAVNAAAAAPLSRNQVRACCPAATAAARMAVSDSRRPQNSSRCWLARSNDQLAAARQASRLAWRLRKPSRPSQPSRGWQPDPQAGQAR
jgi:hypothetical protein